MAKLGKKFRNNIDQFRGSSELSYANFMQFIISPLREVQYKFIKMEDLLSFDAPFDNDIAVNGQKYSFVRHDIDLDPSRALDLAAYEAANGILGTYHFISNPEQCPYNINHHIDDVIQIMGLGHEIGLHFNFRAHSELVALQRQRSLQNGREEESSELGNRFQRPSEGITVEDCLQYIGSDAAYLATIVNERLHNITPDYLSHLTQGKLRKRPDGSVEIQKGKAFETLLPLTISSFSYHMPPKGVIGHNQMIFDIPLPQDQTQKMVYGYYKGFMESAERLSNRYRTDISAGGTAINHYGTPYHAYSETVEGGISAPPIIMINNHPEFWREQALPQADVLKEYVEKLATVNKISFEEADEIMLQIKGESFFEYIQNSPEAKAINAAIEVGLLKEMPDNKLYTADGTHYIPMSKRTGEVLRKAYFGDLQAGVTDKNYAVLGSYLKNYSPFKSEGNCHTWLMLSDEKGIKNFIQFNIDSKTETGKEAINNLKNERMETETVPGVFTNQPYYKTFDFGVVLPITKSQHSVLKVDFFINQRIQKTFNLLNIGNGRMCDSASYDLLKDVGINLDRFIPNDLDRDISVVFNQVSRNTLEKYNNIASVKAATFATIHAIQEQGGQGVYVPIKQPEGSAPLSKPYFGLFPMKSKTGVDFVIMAAPHIEEKAPLYQTLPFDGNLENYSRPPLDIPAAWDTIKDQALLASDENGVHITAPSSARPISLEYLMQEKRNTAIEIDGEFGFDFSQS